MLLYMIKLKYIKKKQAKRIKKLEINCSMKITNIFLKNTIIKIKKKSKKIIITKKLKKL